MVGVARLELATSRSRSVRASQLRHTPTQGKLTIRIDPGLVNGKIRPNGEKNALFILALFLPSLRCECRIIDGFYSLRRLFPTTSMFLFDSDRV